jgi:hypothetical protein
LNTQCIYCGDAHNHNTYRIDGCKHCDGTCRQVRKTAHVVDTDTVKDLITFQRDKDRATDEAVGYLKGVITPPETSDDDALQWLSTLMESVNDWVHDVAVMRFGLDVVATYRLWLPGDENRLLPMPLRYAAVQPASPQAIVNILAGR